MSGSDANMRGLRREWRAAQIFAVIFILLLIAVGALSVLSSGNNQSALQQAALQRQRMAIALCNAALASAEGFALVPGYTKLASDVVQGGSVAGRYTCYAQTDAAKYQITFDLMCRNLDDPKCINLFSVTQDGTGAIYQRH